MHLIRIVAVLAAISVATNVTAAVSITPYNGSSMTDVMIEAERIKNERERNRIESERVLMERARAERDRAEAESAQWDVRRRLDQIETTEQVSPSSAPTSVSANSFGWGLSGTQYIQACNSSVDGYPSMCLLYTRGVLDTIFKNQTAQAPCFHPQITLRQIIAIALKQIASQPELHHLPAVTFLEKVSKSIADC